MEKVKVLACGCSGLTGKGLIPLVFKNNNFEWIFTEYKTAIEFDVKKLFLDAKSVDSWLKAIVNSKPKAIVLLSNIRHYKFLKKALDILQFYPHLHIIGTTGVHSKFKKYSIEYKKIEAEILNYPGRVALLRPSMIYGDFKDKNLHKVFCFVSKYKFFIVFGNGRSLVQPIYYEDLANAIYSSINLDYSGKPLDLTGKDVLTTKELFLSIFKVLGIKPFLIHINPFIMKIFIWLFNLIPFYNFPISIEQVNRFSENKAFPNREAFENIKFTPIPLKEGLMKEAIKLSLIEKI